MFSSAVAWSCCISKHTSCSKYTQVWLPLQEICKVPWNLHTYLENLKNMWKVTEIPNSKEFDLKKKLCKKVGGRHLKVFTKQQHYIFCALLHYSILAEYQWYFLLQCYCLVGVRMNSCGKISCVYVCVHIVYKMGYTFVNGVDWWIKMFHFLSKPVCPLTVWSRWYWFKGLEFIFLSQEMFFE